MAKNRGALPRTRTWWGALGASLPAWPALVAGLGSAGCEPAGSVVELEAVGARQSSLITVFSAYPTAISGVEGSPVSFDIGLLCTDASGADIDVTVTWGDSSPDTQRTLVVAGQPSSPACGGSIMVCDSNDPENSAAGCFGFTHTFADGVAGGSTYNITLTATQDDNTQTAGVVASIVNLPPSVPSIVRQVGPAIEGQAQVFTASASDPGTLPNEIASVAWTFAPAESVQDPTTIACNCANAPHCDDGTNEPLCNGQPSTRSRIFLDDGTYSVQVTVTDKDGGASTETLANIVINNAAPSDLGITATGPGLLGVQLSSTPGAGTTVREGSAYTLQGSFTDPGADAFRSADPSEPGILWYLTGNASPDHAGVAAITKASWPNLDPARFAVGVAGPHGGGVLSPVYIWDEDHANVDGTGHASVTFTVQDDGNASGSITRYVYVQDVDPILISHMATVGGSGVTEVPEGRTVLFSLTAISGADQPSYDPLERFVWRVTNSDLGTGAPADFPSRIAVVAGCTDADTTCELTFLDADAGNDNNYAVDVTVHDEDSFTDTAAVGLTRNVQVLNVAPEITAINASPTALAEGANTTLSVNFTDPAGALDGAYVVEVDWGDGNLEQLPAPAAPGPFTAQHTYAENTLCGGAHPSTSNTCTIVVTLCESSGAPCDQESISVTVLNVAPTPTFLEPLASTQLVEGIPFDVRGSFTDPAGALDDLYRSAWTGFDVAPPSSDDPYGTEVISSGALFTNVGAGGRTAILTYTVTDADGQSGVATREVSIRDNVPTLQVLNERFVDENGDPTPPHEGVALPRFDVQIAAETNADLLTRIEVSWGDGSPTQVVTAGVTGVDDAGTTVTITKPAPYDDGSRTYTVLVRVYDEDSYAEATTSFDVENTVPTKIEIQPAPPGPIVVSEGTAASFVARYTDASAADRAQLLFTFDWGDGQSDVGVPGTLAGTVVTGRGSHLYSSPGTYSVTITVSDGEGASVPEVIQVEVVNVAPVVTDVFNTGPVVEGNPVTVVGLVENRGADDLRFSFTFGGSCDPSDGGVTDADFDEPRPGTSTSSVALSPPFIDDGSFAVCFRVCDDDNLPNSCAYGSTTVVVQNGAPVITSLPPPAPVNEGTPAVVTLVATATDPGASDTLTYHFDCTDDGSIEGSNESGSFDCAYDGSGTWQARVTVTDGDGGSATATVLVRVNNVAPTIASVNIPNVDEGQPSTITVTASDAGNDALTYHFDFGGDGVYDATSITGTVTHTFPSDGAKTVGVRVCDADGACATSSGTTLVANKAPIIHAVSVPSSVTVGSAVTVSVTASDVGNDALSYTFTFKDSSGGVEAIIGPQSSNTVSRSFPSSGAYTVDVRVEDEANAPNTVLSAQTTAGFTVTDINVAVSVSASPSVLNEGGSTTITVTPTGTGPFLVSYDINGDGDFDDDVDVTPSGPTDTCDAPCSTTVTYPQNNLGDLPYRVLVSVVDTGAGDSLATAIVSITVRNVAPTLDEVEDVNAVEGETVSVQLAGFDVGAEDTLRYSLVSAPAGVTLDEETGALSWTPGYEDEGDNEIVVRVSDSDGASASRSFTVSVAIVDENGNGVSDTLERELNGGELLDDNAGDTDSDGDGVSDLEEILAGTDPNVSDAPTAPVVISPIDTRVSTRTPTLVVANAYSPRGATLSYTFVVLEQDGAEVGRVENVSAGASTTQVVFDVEELDEDAAYEWYAFASDGLADGPESERGSFITNAENAPPPAPDALTPLDGATFAFGASPVLEARAVTDPDGDEVWYVFEVSTTEAFEEDDLVAVSAARAVPFYALPDALADGTYYWRAYATDGEAESDYGAASSFTVLEEVVVKINAAPTAPTIVGPADEVLSSNAATLTLGAAMDPDGDAVFYQFEIATNPAFAGATTSGSQAGLTFAVSNLEEDAVYYWRARAHDGELASDWVSAVFAVNASNSAPYGLAILSPPVGAVLDRAPESFTVTNASDDDGDELSYRFTLSESEDLSSPLAEETVPMGDGVTTWAPEGLSLEKGKTYYWSAEVSDGERKLAVSGRFSLADDPVVGPPDEQGCGCSATASATASKSADVPWAALALLGGLFGGLVRRRRR